jgi:hypothetical protein
MPGRSTIGVPRVRFTLGRIVVAVAIVAVALGLAVSVSRRKERCLRLAIYHQDQAKANFAEARKDEKIECLLGLELLTEEEHIDLQTRLTGLAAGLALRKSFKHMRLSEAYRRAADRPWIAFILPSFEPE